MTEKISLYDIHEGMEAVAELEEAEAREYAQALQVQEKNKVNAIVTYAQEMELTAESAEKEAERLLEIAKVYKNRVKRLKDILAYSMEAHGIEKIETDRARLSFRKSKSVEVEDMTQLPKEYIFAKATLSADKKAIKEAIESGIAVPGASLKESRNLQVK